jgi:hypothetical protein
MFRFRTSRRRRGVSFTEMLFSVSIFGISGLFVSTLLVEVARISESSLSMIPSEQSTYRVLDRLRAELLPARARDIVIEGSPVIVDGKQVSLQGTAVTFTNPARGKKMRIWFEDGDCLLDSDYLGSESRVTTLQSGLQNVQFRFPDRIDRRRVEIIVSRPATVTTVTRTPNWVNRYSDTITLRN